ncbi:MAG TPA: ArsA family ATPase, partial [Gemmatimonadaceae bacterium]
MSALDSLLDTLPGIVLVAGKGGVGKTTFAVGLGAAFARRGEKTLVVSTDPAAALGDVIGAPVGGAMRPVRGSPRLQARQLDAAELRAEFLSRWRMVIAEIVDRGTYLARAEIDGLVDAALPGADEIFALLALADVIAAPDRPARIVVDTAPTGHTLRLLELPAAWSGFLESNAGGTSCLGPLAGLKAQQAIYEGSRRALVDADRTTIVIVSRPDVPALA